MTGISFEQAREIVRALNEPHWITDGAHGTYTVADYGYEDADRFLIMDGAREYLVDGNPDFVLLSSGVNIVDKATGEVLYWSYFDHGDEIDSMTPIPGHEPPPRAGCSSRRSKRSLRLSCLCRPKHSSGRQRPQRLLRVFDQRCHRTDL
uniref:hypothetical protein n=1 Tax=Paenarthrobacter ureafaciens TaxID=37931 RepID=UPI003F49682B